MAYNVGNGDIKQTNVVIKTLNAKLLAIPGATCNGNLSYSTNGEVLSYYVRGALSATSGTAGGQLTYTAKGLIRKQVVLDDAQHISDVIPGVNVANTDADVVLTYLTEESILASNNINEDFLQKVETASHTATATYSASDVYGSILKLRAEFVTDNKKENMKPTAIIVSPSVYSELMKQDLLVFKNNEPTRFADMVVVEAVDTTKNVIMMNGEAMISGTSLKVIQTADAVSVGYPGGTLIGGEIVYKNEATQYPSDYQGHPILAM